MTVDEILVAMKINEPPGFSLEDLEEILNETRKNAIVEYLDYQIPVTQLMGPKGNGDMQAAKRD